MNQDPSPPESTTPAVPDVEALLVKARAVFTDKEQERGTPEAPTRAGFLALARAGKEVWNVWRKAYPKPMPDFSKVNLRVGAAIDFSSFCFGDRVRFDGGAQFGSGAGINDAQVGEWASFIAWKTLRIQNYWERVHKASEPCWQSCIKLFHW